MMTELSQVQSAEQILTFLYAVILGGVLCLVFDLFRLHRATTSVGSIVVFAEDLLFFIVSAVVVFCFFMIRCHGVLRLYVFAGIIPGFLVVRYTVSPWFLTVMIALINIIKRCLFFFLTPMIRITTFVFSKFQKSVAVILLKIKNIFKRKKKPLENGSMVDV